MLPFILAAVGGYLIGDSMKSQSFAKGGVMPKGDIKSLNGYYQSYYKGQMAGKSDLVNIENESDVKKYVESKLGKVKSVTEIYKQKNYPYNSSNPYFHDRYSVVLKDGTKFELERQYGTPTWDGNVDYIENITVEKKYADGGTMEEEDMSVQFIDYKGKTIMFEPHYKEYFTNDIQFDSLKDAKEYIDSGSPDPSWEKFVYAQGLMADGGIMAKGGSVKKDIDGYVVYFGVFRGRGLTPVITEYHEKLEDAEKSVEQKKAKKEKGWKVKALDKMPVSSEVRMGRDNANYNKVKEAVHSEEKVTEFFKDKDSFYKKDYSWVIPDGYTWDNWQLKKN